MKIYNLPREDNSFYYPQYNNYVLSPELYFVFGSNLAGRHGRGAAKTAHDKHGAQYGIGIGFTGKAYAIPTKDFNIETLPLSEIKIYIDLFTQITKVNRFKFYVTSVGTGLAGYEDSDIAPLFKDVRNCWLPLQWREYILSQDEVNERLKNGYVNE